MSRKKRKRRGAFQDSEPTPPTSPANEEFQETILADDPSPGLFGYLRSLGVRETIESLIIAIALALLFKTYEAEAFIIPTGSMAPSLNGQHVDLACENCGYQYHSGASTEAEFRDIAEMVVATRCPICRYETPLRRSGHIRPEPDHESNKGDRILVNKYVYDFLEPQRFDVIVFKNPNNGKQNYIKRLIGLPGENILIESGDVYVMKQGDEGWDKQIARKPPRKLRHILQVVDDTHHIGDKLKKVNWPSRWQAFSDQSDWSIEESEGHPQFQPTSDQENWLRYRHLHPFDSEWSTIEEGDLPGRLRDKLPTGALIGDVYGYNGSRLANGEYAPNKGLHWVGDIGLFAEVQVENSAGEIMLDVVEGGAHFLCVINVQSGKATLSVDDSVVDTKVTFTDESGVAVANPTAMTSLSGAGDYRIEYVNADDQIHLWINNQYVEFDASTYTRKGIPIPTYSKNDPGDAEPLGIGCDKTAKIKISRLKVVRDIYYTSVKGNSQRESNLLSNETGINREEVNYYNHNPELWATPNAKVIYESKKGANKPMFELKDDPNDAKDQFLPMGDNSPRSSDGRVWNGPNYVERDLLIGRALFVYWPHSLNKPIPYFPNFGEMGFIR